MVSIDQILLVTYILEKLSSTSNRQPVVSIGPYCTKYRLNLKFSQLITIVILMMYTPEWR